MNLATSFQPDVSRHLCCYHHSVLLPPAQANALFDMFDVKKGGGGIEFIEGHFPKLKCMYSSE